MAVDKEAEMLNNGSMQYDEGSEMTGFLGSVVNRLKNFFGFSVTEEVEEIPVVTPEVDLLKQVFRLNILEKPLDFEEIVGRAFKPNVRFVLDASVTSVKNVRALLRKFCEEAYLSEFKIVLTSVTIRELQMLQKRSDSDGQDARFILNHAIDHGNMYQLVQISEDESSPDNCIIKYCVEHKDDVVLLTSDKEMALNAKMKQVQVLFFKQADDKSSGRDHGSIVSLYPVRRIGDQLFTGELQTAKRSMMVISQDGSEHSRDICELHVGDDVLIASLRDDCVIFVHYKIISLKDVDNARTVYNKRYYGTDVIDELEDERYRRFLKEFIRKHKNKVNF